MTDRLKLLQQLRDSIPEFTCIPGCTQCCGHVPWSRIERDLLPDELRAKFYRLTFVCSFREKGKGCIAHEHRPLVCRAFGPAEGMACPRGIQPENHLDKASVVAIMKTYQKHFFEEE